MKHSDGVERYGASRYDNLAIETIEEALSKLSPETSRGIIMDMLSQYNLRSIIFLEGMLYAIGYIRGETHLCLHLNISSSGFLLYLFQQSLSLLLIVCSVKVIIYHIESYQPPTEFLIAHQHSHVKQCVASLRIFHWYQYLFIISFAIILWHLAL